MGSHASLKTSRTLWNCDRIGKSQSDLPKMRGSLTLSQVLVPLSPLLDPLLIPVMRGLIVYANPLWEGIKLWHEER